MIRDATISVARHFWRNLKGIGPLGRGRVAAAHRTIGPAQGAVPGVNAGPSLNVIN